MAVDKKMLERQSKLKLLLNDDESSMFALEVNLIYALSKDRMRSTWLEVIGQMMNAASQIQGDQSLAKKKIASAVQFVSKNASLLVEKNGLETARRCYQNLDRAPLKKFYAKIIEDCSSLISLSESDNEFWDKFQVLSEVQWQKYSRVSKAKTLLHQYYTYDRPVFEMFEAFTQCDLKHCIGAQLLLSLLSQQL